MMGVHARRSWSDHSMGLKKGSWTPEEDQKLMSYIKQHGHGTWSALPAEAERREELQIEVDQLSPTRYQKRQVQFAGRTDHHSTSRSSWKQMVGYSNPLAKRTDNDIKNYWNTQLKKRLIKTGIDPVTHKPKTYAPTSTSADQFKDAANLSHMVQWESARLEAEARFVQEYNLRRQYKPELSAIALSITHSLPAPPKALGARNARLTSDCSLFADPLFNSSENALPAELPRSIIGQVVNDNC